MCIESKEKEPFVDIPRPHKFCYLSLIIWTDLHTGYILGDTDFKNLL